MGIYVNRILNLKKIRAIGLDMDHTIVRYQSQNFEGLTYSELIRKLVDRKKYPPELQKIPFDYHRVIRGLIIDKRHGNLVKISLYGRVKQAYHGSTMLDYGTMNRYYEGMVIDLNDPNFRAIDTSFSIGEAGLFMNLVDYKDKNPQDPFLSQCSYEQIGKDIQEVLDQSHRDGSLKGEVAKNLERYIIQDPQIPLVLEKFKRSGKKIIIITNSDWHYCKLLMDYTFNPFLQDHADWKDLFHYTITLAQKPSFFVEKRPFLRVDPTTGGLTNFEGPLLPGIYQGGSANFLQDQLGYSGEEILYIGDHIYGDILRLKKICHWRTALVLEELNEEVTSLKKAASIDLQLGLLMEQKERLEWTLNETAETQKKKAKVGPLMEEIQNLNEKLSSLIEDYTKFFNPYWGEMMRAGQEESGLMGQVAKYACIYMSNLGDFTNYSSRHYFRPRRRPLPHEFKQP